MCSTMAGASRPSCPLSSTATICPSGTTRRTTGLLGSAAEVHRTGLVESGSHAHQAGSEILVGLVDRLLAVWDGKPARGYGGTADVVVYARRTGVPVRVLWPEGASRG
jgi:hypothetical protein